MKKAFTHAILRRLAAREAARQPATSPHPTVPRFEDGKKSKKKEHPKSSGKKAAE